MPYKNIAELLILNANQYPDKIAIIYNDNRISYSELNKKVNKIANGLKRIGVKAGDKIGYLFPNCNELIEVYFAIQKIGAIAVPLNFRLIPQEIKTLVNFCKCKLLIYSDMFIDKICEAKQFLYTVEHFICSTPIDGERWSLKNIIEFHSSDETLLFLNENAVSRIQFTGGTTGLPKGVMRTHRNDIAEIVSVMMSSKIGANTDERVLVQCPLEHHGGHSWFVSAIGVGATLIICDTFHEDKILSIIERERVTYLLLLPPSTHLRLLNSPNFHKYDVSSIKFVQSAAGATSPEIISKIYEGYPNCQMNYGWGQTESGTGSSILLTLQMLEDNLEEIRSIGKPMPFIEMKIIDENNNELPIGEIGECVVRGPSVMAGYYEQPQLNDEVFLEDGWLRTGDMMKKDENGYLYLVSRKKDMIKSGGENIFSQEVVNIICKHPSVENCIVFGVPDQKFGEAVKALVQLKPGRTLSLVELQEHCKKFISSYKKPVYLDYIEKFPIDDAGKIPKYKLIEQYKNSNTKLID